MADDVQLQAPEPQLINEDTISSKDQILSKPRFYLTTKGSWGASALVFVLLHTFAIVEYGHSTMTLIWGFDLSEMHWRAFRSKNMFDKRWHLRRERFVVYQAAMLISLAAECTATYSLSKYEDQQTNIEMLSGHAALVHNNNLIDSAIVTIVFCVLVATIFGADFFFLVLWPQRQYPLWYHTVKKFLAVVIALGMGIAAFTSTIIVARESAWITGISPSAAQQYLDIYFRPPLVYRHYPQNIAWVVLIWLAFLSTVASTWLMFVASAHDIQNGTAPSVVGDKDVESTPFHGRNSQSMITSTAMRGEKPMQEHRLSMEHPRKNEDTTIPRSSAAQQA